MVPVMVMLLLILVNVPLRMLSRVTGPTWAGSSSSWCSR
jgi:hypothetical protein